MAMELTGDLSDFALTDILQILALSRKTGTVLLENAAVAGQIIIEEGRITHASLWPGESFADCLVKRELLDPELMGRFKEIGKQSKGIWTVESLIVESGRMTYGELQDEAKRHVQRVIGKLVGLEKGRFGIAVNEATVSNLLDEVKLGEGLEVGEVLLGSAKENDEALRYEGEETPELLNDLSGDAGGYESEVQLASDNSSHLTERGLNGDSHRSELLCSLLSELRFHSFEAEVSLAIMRYASEVATRGILFAVKDFELCGLGQFGLTSTLPDETPDRFVRALHIPLDVDSLFSRVVRTGLPFVGPMPRDYWNMEILSKLGEVGSNSWLFALPLICDDRATFVVYGDNYPGGGQLRGISELEALASQASLVLEKIALERKLMEAEARVSAREA